MNTEPAPTLAERVAKLTTGQLCVRLQHARGEWAASETVFSRTYWHVQISAIESEIKARGERVT